ncbi:MAG TPA: SGNH/GDSL hydrolase family protein [Steroidobacteraceae bacterium]|nr:SGNH/GDSL hydrolase family protein [Steroidobacteraceae bacterium]
MTSWRALLYAALSVAALANPVHAATWVGTWGAAPLPPTKAAGPAPATPSFANQTIRQVVRISAGGKRVRVRFTNEYGTKPLTIGAARIALADEKGNVQAGTDRQITFDGKPGTTIPTGAPLLSDPVDLPVKALATLSISLFVPEDTGPCTCHAVGMQTAYVSEPGDFTKESFAPKEKIFARAFISGVEVESATPAKAIAVLGDSISDGVGSTNDANRRWPDLLAERLAARGGKSGWGVVNMGISGNRLLSDGAGQSALARFDRDVLSVPGLGYVIVFLGVNDLGIAYGNFGSGPMAEFFKSQQGPNKATAESMIAGYRQLIARAHEHGVKIYGATIAPYEGAFYYSAEGNSVREAINQWLRTSGAFDAVLDFDAVFRDPAKPTQMAIPLQAGDHLHGSDAGYEAVAKSIDLKLFK